VDEIAAMRRELTAGDFGNPDWSRDKGAVLVHAPRYERIVATLEELVKIAAERLDALEFQQNEWLQWRQDLIDAQGERDTWRAEAEDQRATVARLEAERDQWREAAGEWLRAREEATR
jgi:septal ring factor EnvC (AmiA/AmiB activator)